MHQNSARISVSHMSHSPVALGSNFVPMFISPRPLILSTPVEKGYKKKERKRNIINERKIIYSQSFPWAYFVLNLFTMTVSTFVLSNQALVV